MDPTMDFTWKGIFYAAEAYLLILLGADFLSDGILPVNRAVGTWQRIKKALVGCFLLAGGVSFYFQMPVDAAVLVSVGTLAYEIPTIFDDIRTTRGSFYYKLSRVCPLALGMLIVSACLVICVIRFLQSAAA